MVKETKVKEEIHRQELKQGLRDATGVCRAAAAQQDFIRPPHLATVEGVDLLGRLSIQLFGTGNKAIN